MNVWLLLFANWSLSFPRDKIPVQVKKQHLFTFTLRMNEGSPDHTGLLDKIFKAYQMCVETLLNKNQYKQLHKQNTFKIRRGINSMIVSVSFSH